jgi:2-polyprenyl-6-methoxyphenol hydroxylase-like FAD-dependent oxidoreductase
MSRADGPLQVAVAGGSIGGLCAGLALHRIAGAEVVIYERHVGEVETRGAGIVVQPELTELLRLVEAAELPTTGCRVRRYLEPDGGEGSEQVMPQRFTCAAIQPPARARTADRWSASGTTLTP